MPDYGDGFAFAIAANEKEAKETLAMEKKNNKRGHHQRYLHRSYKEVKRIGINCNHFKAKQNTPID